MAVISRLPRPIYENYEWQEQGSCRRGDNAAVFFSTDKELPTLRNRREAEAKEICAACPVVAMCLTHALSAQEAQGIWGGTTERERAAMTPMQRETALGRTQTRPLAG